MAGKQRRESVLQFPNPDSPNFAQFVLSQVCDYDEERKELQRRLRDLKYLQLRRALSVIPTGADRSDVSGTKSAPLQRRRGSSVSDFSRFQSGGIDVLGTLLKYNTLTGDIGEEEENASGNGSDEEKERGKDEVSTDDVRKAESPIVPQLMSSEAIQILTDMKSEKVVARKTAFKKSSVVSKPRIDRDASPTRLRTRTSSFERRPSFEQRPNSGTPRPRSGVKRVEFSDTISHREPSPTLRRRSKTDTDLLGRRQNSPPLETKGYLKKMKRRKKRNAQICLKKEGRGIFIKFEEASESDEQSESDGGICFGSSGSSSKREDQKVSKTDNTVSEKQTINEKPQELKNIRSLPNIKIMEMEAEEAGQVQPPEAAEAP